MIKIILTLSCLLLALSDRVALPWNRRRASAAYSEERSRFFADLVAIAYCPGTKVRDWSCKLCKKHPELTKVTYVENYPASIVGFIGYLTNTDEIILSWRGSIYLPNYFEDNNF